MSTLEFKVIDLDFPVGSRNKTATLVTGEREALLIDTGFTRADGHRLVAEVLDSGRQLTKVFVSHSDPDFYWGAEVVADAFPQAELVATPPVIAHIRAAHEGRLKAWETVGANRPTRLVDLAPLTDDLVFDRHRFELKGGHPALPGHHYLWQAERRAIVGGVLLFQNAHVWTADTPGAVQRDTWIELLNDMEFLEPALVVPGHRRPGTATDASAIPYTRDYLLAFETILPAAADAAEATEELLHLYPDAGLRIAAEVGPKVAKGELAWT